ncbi:hypothetical protein M9H77_31510 [Catharanthus roseus]|uniref:Uncharacterized protein n=1 Tax=Catharanthus roseus TaxID=4058 RepID=A0ACC0A4J3_CATRO|nr:hypothetical protein M9H77_31510 [Catharanthus roseus]
MGFGSRYYLENMDHKHQICVFLLKKIITVVKKNYTAVSVTQSIYVDTASCSKVELAALWRVRRDLKPSLVPRGTQILYSAAVDLVAGLGNKKLRFYALIGSESYPTRFVEQGACNPVNMPSCPRCGMSGGSAIGEVYPLETEVLYVMNVRPKTDLLKGLDGLKSLRLATVGV